MFAAYIDLAVVLYPLLTDVTNICNRQYIGLCDLMLSSNGTKLNYLCTNFYYT